MSNPFRILVIGAYGTFGGWIAKGLMSVPGISVIVGGRSLERARNWVVHHQAARPGEGPSALAVDTERGGLAGVLAASNVDLVIHCAGPFQEQGYEVAMACIEARCHYIDLSDGRAFVSGIRTLNDAAREAGVTLVSGASSVPGLSSAVVQEYLPEFSRLDSIRMSISPGNQAPRGPATVESVLSYTGQAFTRWEAGASTRVYGWQDMRRCDYGDLGHRWIASCDVPDLSLFPKHYEGVQTVTFHAGLELSLLHFGMWVLAWLARWRLVASWRRYAKTLTAVSRVFEKMGSDCGGMRVELAGRDRQDKRLKILWRLIARDGHGPRVPVTPSVVLAKRMASGDGPPPGAYPCIGLFKLEEFTRELGGLNVTQEVIRME